MDRIELGRGHSDFRESLGLGEPRFRQAADTTIFATEASGAIASTHWDRGSRTVEADITDPTEARSRIIKALISLEDEGKLTLQELSERMNQLVGSHLADEIGLEWLMVPTKRALQVDTERPHPVLPELSENVRQDVARISTERLVRYNSTITNLLYGVKPTVPTDQILQTVGDLRAASPDTLIRNYYNISTQKSDFLKGLVERRRHIS
jgi:hypothetical protein